MAIEIFTWSPRVNPQQTVNFRVRKAQFGDGYTQVTAQESMNVDNMSFVVPAGTGDAVLRYGCYLDRNGQMVLTILSRFDAFAARNNNVIRAASSA